MKPILAIFCSILALFSFGQKENSYLRKGNSQYKEGHFKEAEKDYRKALEVNKESPRGQFNLGTAVYQEKNYKESGDIFSALAGGKNMDKETKAKAFHNLGNSMLESKEYEKSIAAYKNALINNPKDLDTKYNLEYARMMLKKQQQQQQQNQDKNKDQKKDKQDQNQQNQDQSKQDQQPDSKKISKEDAERMLEAMKNAEKNTMEKVKKQQAKAVQVRVARDW